MGIGYRPLRCLMGAKPKPRPKLNQHETDPPASHYPTWPAPRLHDPRFGSGSGFIAAGGHSRGGGPGNGCRFCGARRGRHHQYRTVHNYRRCGHLSHGNAVSQIAKADLLTAYDDAAGRSHFVEFAAAVDLVGQTLIPGVYRATSSLFLTGTVTLDAQGDLNAIWIFQTGSTLITASGSTVALLNGAQACNVLWQIGSDATLGTDTNFVGDILAFSSITLNTRATVEGRVLARNGAVTLDTNTISSPPGCLTVPEPNSALLAVAGIGTLFASRRRGAAVR
jgi:hypothetical protein